MELEQVISPVTALIAPALSQISNQTSVGESGRTNKVMKCVAVLRSGASCGVIETKAH